MKRVFGFVVAAFIGLFVVTEANAGGGCFGNYSSNSVIVANVNPFFNTTTVQLGNSQLFLNQPTNAFFQASVNVGGFGGYAGHNNINAFSTNVGGGLVNFQSIEQNRGLFRNSTKIQQFSIGR